MTYPTASSGTTSRIAPGSRTAKSWTRERPVETRSRNTPEVTSPEPAVGRGGDRLRGRVGREPDAQLAALAVRQRGHALVGPQQFLGVRRPVDPNHHHLLLAGSDVGDRALHDDAALIDDRHLLAGP